MAELFPFQVDGAKYLAERRRAWLCDVPGLGKTAQAVKAWEMTGARTVVVICPAMVRPSWVSAVEEFGNGGLDVNVMRATDDEPVIGAVNICAYDPLLNDAFRMRLLDLPLDVLVVDESHYLKEPGSKRAAAVLGAAGVAQAARRVWLMTGTPMPNHAGELWTTLYTLFSDRIPRADGRGPMNYDQFLDRYCKVWETRWGRSVKGTKDAQGVAEALKPVMLRRTRSDVDMQLPAITWGDLVVEPDVIGDEDVAEWQRAEEIDGQMLRDVINSVRHPDAADYQAIVRDKHIAQLRRMTGLAKVRPVVAQLVEEMRGSGEKILIFAIHSMVLKLARDYLKTAGMRPKLLYGGTADWRREQHLEKFINDPKCRAMVAQINVAGTGIDGLQKACHNVVIMEADWCPSVNYQAIARLHRTGQTNPVTARFASLGDNSLDNIVQRSLRRKTADIDAILG